MLRPGTGKPIGLEDSEADRLDRRINPESGQLKRIKAQDRLKEKENSTTTFV